MIRKLPIISPCVTAADISRALSRENISSAAEEFSTMLASSVGPKSVFLTNSGISAFYLILRALKRLSDKREVMLPAYTAGSLVVAVRKAALKPVLCDISLEDFNLDEDLLTEAILRDTLAVTCVHMFGINMKGIAGLRARIPQSVFLIEDCAQSMGSRTGSAESGSFGDISFFSFNRGKNLPLYGGGCIATNGSAIAECIEKEEASLPADGLISIPRSILKILAFSAVGNPSVYGIGFPLISRFKETRPPKDFTPKKMGMIQAALGLELMARREDMFSARHDNGMALIEGLKEADGVIVPAIPEDTCYVFNRVPVIFKDVNDREKAEKSLWKNGIETSRMYLEPLHRMFDLGYEKGDFSKAVYFAERLLALPAHPGVCAGDIAKMIDIIRESAR
jgi:dTDP-4-amino-4,6-dideoxygalactose transaminase